MDLSIKSSMICRGKATEIDRLWESRIFRQKIIYWNSRHKKKRHVWCISYDEIPRHESSSSPLLFILRFDSVCVKEWAPCDMTKSSISWCKLNLCINVRARLFVCVYKSKSIRCSDLIITHLFTLESLLQSIYLAEMKNKKNGIDGIC